MIYLDSCILIYAVEDSGARGDLVRSRLERTTRPLAISHLVALECLVGPMRTGDLLLRDRYVGAFDRLRMLSASLAEHIRAAELRARHGLRTPDALHLATATLAGCREIWTNDTRLRGAAGSLAVDILAADTRPA